MIWTFEDGVPRFRNEKWKAVFDEQNSGNLLSLTVSTPLFELPIGEDSVKFENWVSKEDVWNRLRTLSQLSILEGESLDAARARVFDAISRHNPAIDEDGRIAVHGRTFFAWTSRIPSDTPA